MYNNSKKWFSQTLLYYEDILYQTDGKLRIGISTNTSDDINFNPPQFNISVSHNFQKSCNLNITQAMDLLNVFKVVLKEQHFNNEEILRKIHKNIELSIIFKLDQNNNQVVQIIIRSNSTDFTKIIVPSDVFSTIAHRLKSFVNDYDQLCYQLLMKNIDNEYRQIITQIPGLIRGISSQIIPVENPDSGASESQVVRQAPAEQTINDLDKFLGENLENIVVPELESSYVKEEKPTFHEVKSDFVEKVLGGNLLNLENILVGVDSSPSPVMDLNTEFISYIGKDISYLPGVSESDLKSLAYISKLLCSLITQSYVKFESPIPTSTPILKYKVNEFTDENLELSYDLLLFFAFTRAIRNRLSDKHTDFIINKSRFYLQLRCYLDVFCFSFLEKADKNQLRSIITNRYKYYDSIGVFDVYKELLVKNNCVEVKYYDIDIFVTEAADKVIGKTMNIDEQQMSLVQSNSFRLPSNNNFTLEQIINEIVPLELDEKMGIDISNKDVSKEIMNWFTSDKPKVTKITKEKTSNIVRFATHYRNEIPEQHRDEFLVWLKTVADVDFKIDDCKFPLKEFGDNIIKGLYIWKPEDDIKLNNSYKYFWTKFEDCMLDKSHIFAIGETTENEQSVEWANSFDDISFE